MGYYYRKTKRVRTGRRYGKRAANGGRVRIGVKRAKRALGLRTRNSSYVPNQIMRVVSAPITAVVVATGASETTTNQISFDILATLANSGLWADAVVARFKTIKIKGFSVNREFFKIDAYSTTSAGFGNMVYRIDHDIQYSTNNAVSVTAMRNMQDTHFRLFPTALAALPQGGISVELKAFARKEQQFILDTDNAPGTYPNTEYWDCQFQMGFEFGVNAAANVSVVYRDTIEMLYDGMEQATY